MVMAVSAHETVHRRVNYKRQYTVITETVHRWVNYYRIKERSVLIIFDYLLMMFD